MARMRPAVAGGGCRRPSHAPCPPTPLDFHTCDDAIIRNMALLRTAGAWGSSEVHSGRGSGVLLRTTSEVAALQQIKEQLEAQSRPAVRCAKCHRLAAAAHLQGPPPHLQDAWKPNWAGRWRAGAPTARHVQLQTAALRLPEPRHPPRALPCRSHLMGPAARQAAAARRRRRAQLSRVLLGALLVAFLTGTTSYRLHLAMKADQDPDEEPGALSGLRSWLAGGRRSLRQGPSGDELLATYNGYRDPGAQGVQLHQEWWLIGAMGGLGSGGAAGGRAPRCVHGMVVSGRHVLSAAELALRGTFSGRPPSCDLCGHLHTFTGHRFCLPCRRCHARGAGAAAAGRGD